MIVSLETILYFFTGAEEIPPEGFNNPPTLSFNPDEVFPTSSTCAVELTLPTQYSGDYGRVKEMLDIGFICHGGVWKTLGTDTHQSVLLINQCQHIYLSSLFFIFLTLSSLDSLSGEHYSPVIINSTVNSRFPNDLLQSLRCQDTGLCHSCLKVTVLQLIHTAPGNLGGLMDSLFREL